MVPCIFGVVWVLMGVDRRFVPWQGVVDFERDLLRKESKYEYKHPGAFFTLRLDFVTFW